MFTRRTLTALAIFVGAFTISLSFSFVGRAWAQPDSGYPDGGDLDWFDYFSDKAANLTETPEGLKVDALQYGGGAQANLRGPVETPDLVELEIYSEFDTLFSLGLGMGSEPNEQGQGFWVDSDRWPVPGLSTIWYTLPEERIPDARWIGFSASGRFGLPTFRLQKCWFWYDGTRYLFQDWTQPTAIEGETPNSPTGGRTVIVKNFPNPFNPQTTIFFELANAGMATLALYDVSGRKIQTLVDGTLPAGTHSAMWDGNDANGTPVPSGVYLARLVAGNVTSTRSMLLVK